MRFDDLKLTRQFLNAIADAGYENATPIQQKAIPPLRAGQDVIGIAQTGTGKTAAFLLHSSCALFVRALQYGIAYLELLVPANLRRRDF